MEFKYGDYVDCRKSELNDIAIFLCYRPDKNTIIVDHEDLIYELNQTEVHKITNKQIINYFDEKIKLFNELIKACEVNIQDCRDRLIKARNKIKFAECNFNKWNQKAENVRIALNVARKLGQTRTNELYAELTRYQEKSERYKNMFTDNNKNLKMLEERIGFSNTEFQSIMGLKKDWETKKAKFISQRS